jgi:hypothetical protein
MSKCFLRCAGVVMVLVLLFEPSRGAELETLQPYVVMLKPKIPLAAVEARVKSRSADPTLIQFRAKIDPRGMFRSSSDMHGFRMMATEEAAKEMRRDDDVRIVERDTIISTDTY